MPRRHDKEHVHGLRPSSIREHIVEGVNSGRWKPGERIVERRIATELEVSQMPVREALRELESMRLIESFPNKGVRVRDLTAADLEEIYTVRTGLEQIAADLAAVASPLAARPYDLRHSALSTWLNSGVDPTEVAQRAGNSVEVLLSRYAKCIDGRQEIANNKIEELLREYE